MFDWLKWKIARKEMEELQRYRLAAQEAWQWNVGQVHAAAETADWIIGVAEGVKPMNAEALRDRLLKSN